jgi:hypothetical protein
VPLEQFANNAASTTTGSVNNSSNPVSITVADASKFPTSGNFRILVDDEIMLVTAVSGAVFTCTRAQESTTIASHSSGAAVTHVLTSASLLKLATERAKSYYPIFTPAATIDDEFDDASFSGWTAVQGTPAVTPTESGSQLSILHPGGGSAGQFASYMKALTLSTNDYIEACFRVMGFDENFMIFGLIMADGATYGAGSQAIAAMSPTQNLASMMSHSNYNSNNSNTTFSIKGVAPFYFMRMTYLGSNAFKGQISVDGISWITYNSSFSRTLTPTNVGFGISKWGGANPMMVTLEYFKKGP